MTPVFPGCGQQHADIVFVLDESGSIWGPDFERQISFVKHIVHDVDVAEDKTHVGTMTFATDVVLHFHLDEVHGGTGNR